MSAKAFKVRASSCSHQATEEEIYQILKRTTEPLTRSWEKLEKAGTIVLKFNMMWPRERIEYFAGRRRELVDDAFAVAFLRLLRERTDARLVATDTDGGPTPPDFNYRSILDDFGVEYDDSNLPPFATYEVPGGGFMFDRYILSEIFREADEVISIAKMKNHGFMGITLTTKNLFGLPPMIPPEGRTRSYYHHIIRLSYVLPDLAKIVQPCLNIVEALTGQRGQEWGGSGLITDAILAGDHPIATDACGPYLMGHDPQSDWPPPPCPRQTTPPRLEPHADDHGSPGAQLSGDARDHHHGHRTRPQPPSGHVRRQRVDRGQPRPAKSTRRRADGLRCLFAHWRVPPKS